MSLSLYNLVGSYNQLWNQIEEMDLDALEDTLQSIEDAIEVKAENYAYMMRMMDAEAEVIKAEEKRLADRRKAVENRKERLKANLENGLLMAGIDKVKTPTVTVAIQNNPPSVQIEDEDLVPEQFVTVEIIRKIDRKSILQALKDGDLIEGCSIKQGKSLRIR